MPNVLIARALGLSSPLCHFLPNSHPIFFLLVFLLSTLAFLCFFQKLAVHLHHLYHHSFRPDSLSLASASEYFSYFIHLYDAFQVINKLRCNSCHKLVIEILCNISPITYFLLSRPFELRCSVYQFLHFGAYLLQQLL